MKINDCQSSLMKIKTQNPNGISGVHGVLEAFLNRNQSRIHPGDWFAHHAGLQGAVAAITHPPAHVCSVALSSMSSLLGLAGYDSDGSDGDDANTHQDTGEGSPEEEQGRDLSLIHI